MTESNEVEKWQTLAKLATDFAKKINTLHVYRERFGSDKGDPFQIQKADVKIDIKGHTIHFSHASSAAQYVLDFLLAKEGLIALDDQANSAGEANGKVRVRMEDKSYFGSPMYFAVHHNTDYAIDNREVSTDQLSAMVARMEALVAKAPGEALLEADEYRNARIRANAKLSTANVVTRTIGDIEKYIPEHQPDVAKDRAVLLARIANAVGVSAEDLVEAMEKHKAAEATRAA